ncbi:hypothetical protein [Streptomyces sp. CA-106131]|uniref:hypothetical protein n=1 Tax=Streptomyces sp. CA-106131 TaxID=3240045 RepID=UPI003D91C3B5
MKAELLDIMPEITDRERAEEFSDQLENLLVEVGGIFPRADLRMRAARCIRGLLSPVSRKNGWQLAEYGGDAEPWGQQHLLDRSVWDVDALRDFTRRYVIDGLDDGGRELGPAERGFWWSTRPASPRRAGPRSGWPGSTPARSAGSSRARSG